MDEFVQLSQLGLTRQNWHRKFNISDLGFAIRKEGILLFSAKPP